MSKDLMDLILLDEIQASPDKRIEKLSSRDIAIIGMSARLPNADSMEEFWDKIAKGTDLIGRIPEERKKDVENYFNFMGLSRETQKLEEGAYLKAIDKFDCSFFNISPNEAALMDPNQRLFLETAWEAVEDAGYGGKKIMGSNTAVFVGFSNETEYRKIIQDTEPSFYSMAVPGNLAPIIASRISYLLDLKGPSMLVNTACSSSLVALHLGCQALKNGECSMALIGGVQMHVLPVRQAEIGIESSSKRTRTFDNSSDGTGGGEGVIAVLLKPLDRALKDGDNIHAVIKGSAYNQDGASAGISAPNPAAQEEVITRAWQEAGIDPKTISYIEAHGTGTKLGDPIEIDGIQRAFRRYTDRRQFCAIGSVKSNIGHLDASAGLAGLLKAVLALQKGQIPPSINFERPNRMIAFHRSPVYVNTRLREWKTDGFPRRCGVSSFGFSGTNCHVILEEAPVKVKISNQKDKSLHLLVLSAKTEGALERLVKAYSAWDCSETGLEDLCYTAGTGRGHYNCRLAILLENRQDLKRKLAKLVESGISGSEDEGIFYGKHKVTDGGKEFIEPGDITQEERNALGAQADRLLASLQPGDDQDRTKLRNICELYIKGADIDWGDLYRFEIRKKVRLPVYPFENRRCWVHIPSDSRDSLEEYFLTRNWRPKELEKSNNGGRNGTILVVSDCAKGQELAAQLMKKHKDVVEARISDVYRKSSGSLYFISTGENDFKRLVEEIDVKNLTQIIYIVMPGNTGECTSSELEMRLNSGLYGFFHLMRQIMNHKLGEIDIVLGGQYANKVDGSEKRIFPEYAALFGLGKVVNVEDFRIKCRCIDIDGLTPVEALVPEIEAGYQDYNIAYRNGRRYVQELTGIRAGEIQDSGIRIKEDGVYVITGGMGGIGLKIAAYLSSKARAKIMLINRTSYPERLHWGDIISKGQDTHLAEKLSAVMDIERNGSLVEIYSADISKYDDVRTVFNAIRARHEKIDGIIHSAAIGVGSQGRLLKEESLDRFSQVISPKIQGTCLLEEETRSDGLDFFVVFSSPITITGAVGSGSYTAANSYLDSFVEARNTCAGYTIAMSWAPWEKTVEASKADFAGNKHMFEVISSDELTKAFDILLGKNIDLAVVGKLNYNSSLFDLDGVLPFRLSAKLKTSTQKTVEKEKSCSNARTDILKDIVLKGRADGIYTTTEKVVGAVWGKVLGYDELNIYDNFYDLGGDSIIAMKVINNLNKKLNTGLNVTDLLSNLTVRQVAACVDKKRAQSQNREYLSVPKAEKKNHYPVSLSQKRILLLSNRRENDISWNMSWAFTVKGRLDTERFEKAFRDLICRHEILRTSFGFIKGEPVQIIEDSIEFNILHQELSGRALDQVAKEFIKPFDLGKAPLLRVGLVKINDGENLLLFDIHHIIADAASMQVLLQDVISAYKGMQLPELPIQYRDFSVWQNNLVSSGAFKKQREYWLNKFGGGIPVLNLPLDYPRSGNTSVEGDKIYAEIDEALAYKLKSLAGRTGTSLFTVLASTFYILIWKFSSQGEITIGVPVSGRTHGDLESLIGMFVNIIVLKSSLSAEKTYMDLLMEVKQDFLESCENCDYPFFELVNDLEVHADINRNPLFDVSLVMQNTGSREIDLGSGLSFVPYEHENSVSRNDILLEAVEIGNKIRFIFEYNSKLFKKDTINGLISSYIKIISAVCENYSIRLGDIKFLSKEETYSILEDFNDNLAVEF